MGRKNSPSANKELNELIAQYETAKAENRQLYLDGDQLADIADRYAAERKFDEAQEVITYGLHLHPDSTDLLVEQAYLYLDTGKIPLAKKVAESITDDYITDVKMLKAELLLNEGQLEAARSTLDTIRMNWKQLLTSSISIWIWDTPKPPRNGWIKVPPDSVKKKIS